MRNPLWLSYPDSNQEMRHQKPLCYHYTIGQSLTISVTHRHNCAAKLEKKFNSINFFANFRELPPIKLPKFSGT